MGIFKTEAIFNPRLFFIAASFVLDIAHKGIDAWAVIFP